MNEPTRVPTVSRVLADTLVELTYDQRKRQTALVVSRFGGLWNAEQEVRIETGEVLVPYAASNNLLTSGCVLLPSAPEPYGTQAELIADIRAFVRRYLDVSPGFETIAAYYILLTWVHDRFRELGYLRLRGDYGTGKTRALLVIGSLCYRPFFASGASTTSPIFHILDTFGGTLILDEADFPQSDARADLTKILNNGTTAGLPVLRTIQNRHKELNPHAFRVFGPKLIAMRGTFQDRALESRFITEDTGMRTLRDDIPVQLPSSFAEEALALRNRLLHFRLSEFFAIDGDSARAIPSANPRLNQTALALLALIEDPRDWALVEGEILARYADFDAERHASPEVRVLAATWAAFMATSGHVPVRAIAERFNAEHQDEYGAPVSSKWVGYTIRARLHLSTRRSGGIYVVPASERPRVASLAERHGIIQRSV
ncbi:MAG: hypothetical protein WDM91_17430 [Rhizomicrobium sp.]